MRVAPTKTSSDEYSSSSSSYFESSSEYEDVASLVSEKSEKIDQKSPLAKLGQFLTKQKKIIGELEFSQTQKKKLWRIYFGVMGSGEYHFGADTWKKTHHNGNNNDRYYHNNENDYDHN